jgi:hypothetical protein
MYCSVHRGRIRGRVHYWNHQAMCGACYARFTSRVRLLRPPLKGCAPRQTGFWEKLARLLGR